MAKKKTRKSRAKPDGSKWRLRERHPRRDMPLRVTLRDGTEVGKPGETCDGVSADVLASLIRNDFVEPVED